jgi:hypothetical protein
VSQLETAPYTLKTPYKDRVNPQWVRLLDLLEMNVRDARCAGAELHTVHNAGHNHPKIIAAIKTELDRQGPAMLQSHAPELAGELPEALCARGGGRLSRVFFASSGSEGRIGYSHPRIRTRVWIQKRYCPAVLHSQRQWACFRGERVSEITGAERSHEASRFHTKVAGG